MPTNTVRIDNKLLQQAVQVSGLATKREVVERALRLLISLQNQSSPATPVPRPSSQSANYHPEVVKMLHTLAAEEPITPPQDTEEFLAWLKQRY